MKFWEKLLLGAAVAGVVGFIAWRSGLLEKLRAHSQSQGLRPVMENEEIWDVESDELGIPKRITIHRKVVG
jgi:hypothetical protein